MNEIGSNCPSDECCPYCVPPYEEFTDDHIFPQFLGGRRTIRVCRSCNSTFGHSFEGPASRQLKRLQVFISHFGLDLSRNPVVWPSALEIGGETYDLISGVDGAQYRLAKPTIVRDAAGRITGGRARSWKEARKFADSLVASGAAKAVEISEAASEALDDIKLKVPLSLNGDLYRFATKLASAVVVAAGRQQIISSSDIPSYLHGRGSWLTSPAYCDIRAVRELRPPLTHSVYVELGRQSYAIVLVFGFLKIFVPIPPSVPDLGLIATLDPLTGEEKFTEVSPVGPRSVPVSIGREVVLSHFTDMNDALVEEALLRGATRKPDLNATDIDLGQPLPFQWSNSTLQFMKFGDPFYTK